jgi:hypothetical protein
MIMYWYVFSPVLVILNGISVCMPFWVMSLLWHLMICRPIRRRWSAKVEGCRVVSVTGLRGRWSWFSRPEPLLFIQVVPYLCLRGWVDPVSDPLLNSENLVAPEIEPGISGSSARKSDQYTTEAAGIVRWRTKNHWVCLFVCLFVCDGHNYALYSGVSPVSVLWGYSGVEPRWFSDGGEWLLCRISGRSGMFLFIATRTGQDPMSPFSIAGTYWGGKTITLANSRNH